MNRRVAFESGCALARPLPAVLLALIFCCGTLHAQSRHTPTHRRVAQPEERRLADDFAGRPLRRISRD